MNEVSPEVAVKPLEGLMRDLLKRNQLTLKACGALPIIFSI